MRLIIKKLFGKYDYDIDFKNKVNILMGENGCGKSTILKIVNFINQKDFISLSKIKFDTIEYFDNYRTGADHGIINHKDLIQMEFTKDSWINCLLFNLFHEYKFKGFKYEDIAEIISNDFTNQYEELDNILNEFIAFCKDDVLKNKNNNDITFDSSNVNQYIIQNIKYIFHNDISDITLNEETFKKFKKEFMYYYFIGGCEKTTYRTIFGSRYFFGNLLKFYLIKFNEKYYNRNDYPFNSKELSANNNLNSAGFLNKFDTKSAIIKINNLRSNLIDDNYFDFVKFYNKLDSSSIETFDEHKFGDMLTEFRNNFRNCDDCYDNGDHYVTLDKAKEILRIPGIREFFVSVIYKNLKKFDYKVDGDIKNLNYFNDINTSEYDDLDEEIDEDYPDDYDINADFNNDDENYYEDDQDDYGDNEDEYDDRNFLDDDDAEYPYELGRYEWDHAYNEYQKSKEKEEYEESNTSTKDISHINLVQDLLSLKPIFASNFNLNDFGQEKIKLNMTILELSSLLNYILDHYKELVIGSRAYSNFKKLCRKYLVTKDVSITFEENGQYNYKITDIETNANLGFEQLSSGEQKILKIITMMCFIINKKSNVLLDEPELSLSIHWQQMLLKDIDKYSDADCIIATQSTSLISEDDLDKVIEVRKDLQ